MIPIPRTRKTLANIGIAAGAATVIAPVAAACLRAFAPQDELWRHLIATSLPGYAINTILLILGVGAASILVGGATAWLSAACEFPGRKTAELIIPASLAVPVYAVAYVYIELLDPDGPLHQTIRKLGGWKTTEQYYFPEIRSLPGAVFVMTAALHPYVHITARAAFIRQFAEQIDVARVLGKSPASYVLAVAIPLARPFFAVGAALVMMECLNDIGAAEALGIPTLTVGIYETWLGKGNLAAASQIAIVSLAFAVALLALERSARSRRKYHSISRRENPPARIVLSKPYAALAVITCFAPPILGAGTPALVLAVAALKNSEQALNAEFAQTFIQTVALAALAAACVVAVGTALAYAALIADNPAKRIAARTASIGYAVPGAVFGIGLLVTLTTLDKHINHAADNLIGITPGLLLSGGWIALILAYVGRFTTVSFSAAESGMTRIAPGVADAARTLGYGPFKTLKAVHLPLLKPALAAAALLVFVDVLKELPATLLLRPFNFETLATTAYAYASHGLFEQSAPYLLAVMALGIAPAVLFAAVLEDGGGIAERRPNQERKAE